MFYRLMCICHECAYVYNFNLKVPVLIIFSDVNLIENANMNLEKITFLRLTFEKSYEISALKYKPANCVQKMIEQQRTCFTLGLGFSNSKGATYNRGFAVNFRPGSTRPI